MRMEVDTCASASIINMGACQEIVNNLSQISIC